jgi:hypothetical protein
MNMYVLSRNEVFIFEETHVVCCVTWLLELYSVNEN